MKGIIYYIENAIEAVAKKNKIDKGKVSHWQVSTELARQLRQAKEVDTNRESVIICDCDSPKYILNEVKQELLCMCGKVFKLAN